MEIKGSHIHLVNIVERKPILHLGVGEDHDVKCSKCNQLRHEAVICKEKAQQHEAEAQVADQEDENQLFVASFLASISSFESRLVDNGCTNHMTHDKGLFIDLKPDITKVKIGNGDNVFV